MRFELDVPLTLVEQEVARRLLADGGGVRHVQLAEGYDLEITGARDSIRSSGSGDSLVIRERVRHQLYVQGATLKRVGCGSAQSPLTVEVACTARLGWNDTWGLEALAHPQGLVFARRCKPNPPQINLTKRAGPAVQEMFLEPLVRATTEVAGAVQTREFLTAVWDALAGGVQLPKGWLDFGPEAVFVDPVRLSGKAIHIRGAVRVRPTLREARPEAAAAAFPAAATNVRLSGSELGVAVTIAAELEPARQALQAAVDSAFAGTSQVQSATLQAAGDTLAIGVDLGGDLAGRYSMTATLDYQEFPPALVARNAAWTGATRAAVAKLEPARQERLGALLALVNLRARTDLRPHVALVDRDLGVNLRRRIGDGLALEGVVHARRRLAVQGAGGHVSVALVLSGPARIRPFAASP